MLSVPTQRVGCPISRYDALRPPGSRCSDRWVGLLLWTGQRRAGHAPGPTSRGPSPASKIAPLTRSLPVCAAPCAGPPVFAVSEVTTAPYLTAFLQFHRKCIDGWLSYQCNACPVDGQVVYNPLLWRDPAERGRGLRPAPHAEAARPPQPELPGLFVPGTGLAPQRHGAGALPAIRRPGSGKPGAPGRPADARRKTPAGDPCPARADEADSRKLAYEGKIRQHFPRYFHDLPTAPLGETPPRAFLPSLARGHHARPPARDAGRSRRPSEGPRRVSRNLKGAPGARARDGDRGAHASSRPTSSCRSGYHVGRFV